MKVIFKITEETNPLCGKEALNKEFLIVLFRMLLCQVAGKCVGFHAYYKR